MSLWKRTTPNQIMAEQIGWQSEKSMQRGWNLMQKVSGHHDINFLTPINSLQASPRKEEERPVQEAKALYYFSLTITSLHCELFWEKDSEHLQSRLPVSENLSPYGIFVSNSNHLKPTWSKTLPVAAWRPSSLFYFHFSPSCLYFVNDIRENDLLS